MHNIFLADGSKKEFSNEPSGFEVASAISISLAKKAIAIKVNDQLQDLDLLVPQNSKIEIITSESEEGLEIIRHDTAHILAQAVKELFPETKITIGPVIKNGFYYDFQRDESFTSDDLKIIEKKMKEIVRRNDKITRKILSRDDAVKFFQEQNEHYKADIISSIPQNEKITLYTQGVFTDLCRGPHSPTTGAKKAFKLTKVAGAYWRGNSNNEMLQRIYGTAWANEQDLNKYLSMIEEAEKRDHRKIGKSLSLFHIQEEATGQIFWHDKGYTIFRIIESYIRKKLTKHNYLEVKTPIIANRALWEKSGHWEKFQENMFTSQSEEQVLALKPMNCPLHVQIFNQGLKSYRDLPLRMSEFGCCHRNESSGSMHGLMRVRGFTQDDAHIFCTPAHITSETIKFTELLLEVYKDFGFEKVKVKFSDRPQVRAGSDEIWDKAETALKEAVTETGLDFELNPGEGAFYGPKLEFVLTDALGRDWQCGTLQVDFVLPERLGATYTDKDNSKKTPVMLHRAILGSFERFIGILIEEYAGKFPLWLAPIQAVITTITSDSDEYAKYVYETLLKAGLRVKIDTSSAKINYKIREHSLQKIPYILVIGKNEAQNKELSIRKLGKQNQEIINLDVFVKQIKIDSEIPK